MKPWSVITAESFQLAEDKGWHDPPPTFKTAMALVHSEISEALEAWRKWGLADTTIIHQTTSERARGVLAKPEGVPSEFADILIRMAHYAEQFDIKVPETAWSGPIHDFYGEQTFLEDLDDLHNVISIVSEWRAAELDFAVPYSSALIMLRHLAAKYGIDLATEYERKMSYNRTRPMRHGGKRA